MTLPTLVLLAHAAHAGGIPAVHGVLQHAIIAELPAGVPQILTLSAGDRPATFYASCTVGKATQEDHSEVIAAGEHWAVALPEAPGVTAATCLISASFANGMMERKEVQLQWSVLPPPPVEPVK